MITKINSSCIPDIFLERQGPRIFVQGSSSFVEEMRKADDYLAHIKFLAKKLLLPEECLDVRIFQTKDDDTDYFRINGIPNIEKKWIYINKCPFRTTGSITQCHHPSTVHDGIAQDCLCAPCPFSREFDRILIEPKTKGEEWWVWEHRMRQEAGPVHIEPIKVVMIDEVKLEGF